MTPRCPRDVRPKNFLFGLVFRSLTCVAKTCAVRPVFARVVGKLWTAHPKRSWEPGHQQHPGPENQDGQQRHSTAADSTQGVFP